MVSYYIVFQQTKVPIKDKSNMKNYCTTVSSARSLERYITFFKIVNWYLLVLVSSHEMEKSINDKKLSNKRKNSIPKKCHRF